MFSIEIKLSIVFLLLVNYSKNGDGGGTKDQVDSCKHIDYGALQPSKSTEKANHFCGSFENVAMKDCINRMIKYFKTTKEEKDFSTINKVKKFSANLSMC